MSTPKERVIVYIDGFNLYYGMLSAGYEQYKWLNLHKLAEKILRENQILQEVKYFTSRVGGNPDKMKRQNTFIEALEYFGVQIFYGEFQNTPKVCKHCNQTSVVPNEKKTDVNIATQMLSDAMLDKFDVAMLISGDTDLVPPIEALHSLFQHKRVFVIFPPNRANKSIKKIAKGSMVLGRTNLAQSQLPLQVTKKDGFILKKPSKWQNIKKIKNV